MRKNSFEEEGTKYFVKNPCKPLEPCSYEDDYDPCESNEDLTEKDLAVLLKEEAAKLKTQNEANVTRRNEQNVRVPKIITQSNAEREREQDLEDSLIAYKVQPDEKKKKKICKNFIKNPFFTNPFKFSCDLPPPPSSPPPQLYPPLLDESSVEKICQKGKKKKNCKKSKVFRENSKEDDFSVIKRNYSSGIDNTENTDETEVSVETKAEVKTEVKTELQADVRAEIDAETDAEVDGEIDVGTEPSVEDGSQVDADDKGVEGDVEDEADEEWSAKSEEKTEQKRKRCKKRSERPSCKKKASVISISLLPPQIPPLQKDLPLTSPKDIPEVERQVLLAYGGKSEQKCKKRLDKVKFKRTS